MIVRTLLVPLVFVGTVLAQVPGSAVPTNVPSASTNQPGALASADSALAVAPDQAVIRIQGICSSVASKADPAASCEIVVTREEFEKLVQALEEEGQPTPASALQNLAEVYADLLTFEQAAKKAGLEKDPQYQQFLRWQYLRSLASLYRLDLQRKYRNPGQHEIDDYYRKNASRFTEMKLQHIVIPKRNPSAQDQAAYQKSALKLANLARQRAVKGEDLAQIQNEVYDSLALGAPPAVDMGIRRKASMAAEEGDEVFSLNPGEVSKVENEIFNYVIYKVESKRLLPLESVKDEIAREIAKEKLESALRAVKASGRTELNPRYFPTGNPAREKISTPSTPLASPSAAPPQ